MTVSITDRIILITGASSGIGSACARLFAQAGARLILAARRKEKLQSLTDELQQSYPVKTLLLPLDVQKCDAVSTAIEGLPTDW
ncbi:MAG: SDR family NAD(P)-dependent oxidoreductase, partial [Cyanobacteria bacterium J06636_16]